VNKSRVFLVVIAAEAVGLGILFASGAARLRAWERAGLPAGRAVVARLGLTDLALWTEARYTRHPSQADRFAPFQDMPSAPEHFPGGSFVVPGSRPGRRF
jgi:hypothetical protein